MLNTARRNISYPNPDRSDRPDIPLHIGNVAAAADTSVVYTQGTDAARIAAAHQASGGRFWWTTDTHLTWYDDGATWWLVDAGIGKELDYAQITSDSASITATTEATAQSIIIGNSITYDGTRVKVAFWCPEVTWVGGTYLKLVLFRDAVVVGFARGSINATSGGDSAVYLECFDVPPAGAHTYSVKAYVSTSNANINAGAGGSGNRLPAYLRVTKA